MKEVLIPGVSGVLYCVLVGFSFFFRDHFVTYAVASVCVIPAGYFFNRISSIAAFLILPLLLTILIVMVNTDMFSITMPILGLGIVIGYITGYGVFKTRILFWKWIILLLYLLLSTAIVLMMIPHWLLSTSVEDNKQILILPPAISSLSNNGKLLELNNKILVIEFWQSNCSACLRQFSVLDRVQNKYKSSPDVAIIAMNTGVETEDDARATFMNQNSNLFAALDKNQKLARQLAVKSIPVLVIVDRNNRVHWKHNGFYNEEKDILDEEIIKHIEEIR